MLNLIYQNTAAEAEPELFSEHVQTFSLSEMSSHLASDLSSSQNMTQNEFVSQDLPLHQINETDESALKDLLSAPFMILDELLNSDCLQNACLISVSLHFL